MDMLTALARVAVESPLLFVGAVWLLSARWAKHRKVPLYGLGALAIALNIHKNRRELRGVVTWSCVAVLALVWALALLTSPRFRFGVGVALPTGCVTAAWLWLVTNYGSEPPLRAVRLAIAEYRDREVLTEAVSASAEGARVVKVTPLDGGDVEAEIIGPAGVSHTELLGALRDTLAESVLAVSGRVMRNVAVVGNGARGAVKVRCSTADPYSRTMTLDEVRQ